MANFGSLMAEIGLGVWGTPANFNGFRILAVLLHGTLIVGVNQTAALNRGRHLYSAGWLSRSALAHILVFLYFSHCLQVAVVTCSLQKLCEMDSLPHNGDVDWQLWKMSRQPHIIFAGRKHCRVILMNLKALV